MVFILSYRSYLYKRGILTLKLTLKEWECFYTYIEDLVCLLYEGSESSVSDGKNSYTADEIFTIKGKIVNIIKKNKINCL